MALEKPFVYSKTAEGDPDPVNFNDVFTFKKSDEITTGVSPKKYFIEFHRDENSAAPQVITWKYLNSCDRNAEFDILIGLIAKPIQ